MVKITRSFGFSQNYSIFLAAMLRHFCILDNGIIVISECGCTTYVFICNCNIIITGRIYIIGNAFVQYRVNHLLSSCAIYGCFQFINVFLRVSVIIIHHTIDIIYRIFIIIIIIMYMVHVSCNWLFKNSKFFFMALYLSKKLSQ